MAEKKSVHTIIRDRKSTSGSLADLTLLLYVMISGNLFALDLVNERTRTFQDLTSTCLTRTLVTDDIWRR